MYTRLLSLLLLPLLALAQNSASGTNASGSNDTRPAATPAPPTNSNGSATPAPASSTIVITSVDSVLSFLPGRVQTTILSTHLITSVVPVVPTGSAAPGNGSNAPASNTASSTATPANLPTANPSVDGGGQNGAPSPGAKSPSNAFGPDDNYIAAAATLAKNAVMVTIVGSLVGGAMVLA